MTRVCRRLSAMIGMFLVCSLNTSVVFAQATDNVYLDGVARGGEAWYVNQLLRGEFVVVLRNVTDQVACRKREVIFRATQGMPTGDKALLPPEVRLPGMWVVDANGNPRCQASMRWRLGDIPGSQELVATLTRAPDTVLPDSIVRREGTARWRASAHMPPSLVGGFAYAVGPNPPPPAPTTAADSALFRRGQPFFGVELVPGLDFVRSREVARVLEHVRLMAGTSYRSPGFDFYLGASPLALIDGLRATGLPVQLTVGRRWSARGNDTYFLGGTVSAASVLGNLINQIRDK